MVPSNPHEVNVLLLGKPASAVVGGSPLDNNNTAIRPRYAELPVRTPLQRTSLCMYIYMYCVLPNSMHPKVMPQKGQPLFQLKAVGEDPPLGNG